MSNLTTRNALAIQQLMNDTLFKDRGEEEDLNIEEYFQPLKFWGGNQERVLFLLSNPEQDYFTEEAKDAFLKTMTALKLSIEDVAVVNNGNVRKLSFEEICRLLTPRICVFLGKDTWGDNIPLHEIFQRNDMAMINTYSFEEMLNDDEKKRAFWKAIKAVGI